MVKRKIPEVSDKQHLRKRNHFSSICFQLFYRFGKYLALLTAVSAYLHKINHKGLNHTSESCISFSMPFLSWYMAVGSVGPPARHPKAVWSNHLVVSFSEYYPSLAVLLFNKLSVNIFLKQSFLS